jgi:hypothetical protein
MFLPLEVFGIAAQLLATLALMLIAMILMRQVRHQDRDRQWQRVSATATALNLSLEHRLLLQKAQTFNLPSISVIDFETPIVRDALLGLGVAEHLAFCITDGIYDRQTAGALIGDQLVHAFRQSQDLIYAYRAKAAHAQGFIHLELFSRQWEQQAHEAPERWPVSVRLPIERSL